MSKIVEVKLSSRGFEVAIVELRLRSNISLKVVQLRLRKLFLQVAELRLRTQKKVVHAHLWLLAEVGAGTVLSAKEKVQINAFSSLPHWKPSSREQCRSTGGKQWS